MKLDRFKFAMLVAWIAHKCDDELSQSDIGELDQFTEMLDPLPTNNYVRVEDVNALLNCMATNWKTEAIRLHRSMTGFSLKDSEDIIETVMNKMKS